MHDGDAGAGVPVRQSGGHRRCEYRRSNDPCARGGNALTVGFSVLQVYVFRAVAFI